MVEIGEPSLDAEKPGDNAFAALDPEVMVRKNSPRCASSEPDVEEQPPDPAPLLQTCTTLMTHHNSDLMTMPVRIEAQGVTEVDDAEHQRQASCSSSSSSDDNGELVDLSDHAREAADTTVDWERCPEGMARMAEVAAATTGTRPTRAMRTSKYLKLFAPAHSVSNAHGLPARRRVIVRLVSGGSQVIPCFSQLFRDRAPPHGR